VNLKIIEVVVLVAAGVLFVAWQFRDLRRAKEITRRRREAEKMQATQDSPKPEAGTSMLPLQSHSK
jgi:hypothetical protein